MGGWGGGSCVHLKVMCLNGMFHVISVRKVVCAKLLTELSLDFGMKRSAGEHEQKL